MLLLSVNQTILFALSMVVIAGLIGGAGLGDVFTNGLYSNPALALLGGAAIVIMALAVDRATEAMAERTDPAKRHLTSEKRTQLRLFTGACAAAVGLAAGLGYAFHAGSAWSRWTAQDWLLHYVQKALDYVQNPATFVFHITDPIGIAVIRDSDLRMIFFHRRDQIAHILFDRRIRMMVREAPVHLGVEFDQDAFGVVVIGCQIVTRRVTRGSPESWRSRAAKLVARRRVSCVIL